MLDIFSFKCSGKLNSLGSRTQENVKTPLITSLKRQESIQGKKHREGNNKSLTPKSLTISFNKAQNNFLISLCHNSHSAAVPALTECQRQSQKTKQLERKSCSQNPSVYDFHPQRRHKTEQGRWVILSFSLLIPSQASHDKKGDTQENRPTRMPTQTTQVNPLVFEC